MIIVSNPTPLPVGGVTAIAGGTTFATGPAVSFGNANGVTFGVAGNLVTASFGAVATGAIGAISAGTTQITSGTVSFANANGVTFGVAGNTLTASIATPTPVTTIVQSVSILRLGDFATNNTVWPGLMSLQAISLPLCLSGSSGYALVELLGDSGSSGGLTLWAGAYQITGSTAGNLTSRSGGFSWTSGSGTASSVYGGVSGTRYQSFPWDLSMSAGDYVLAFAISAEGNGTARIFGRQGANIVGPLAGGETNYFLDGYTNSTVGAFPPTIVANNTNYVRTGLSAQRQPALILFGTS